MLKSYFTINKKYDVNTMTQKILRNVYTNLIKNEENLLGTVTTVTATTSLPTGLAYSQGALSSTSIQTTYSFTVPANCLYFVATLIAGGGRGGNQNYQVATKTFVSGGGGAGAWCKVLVTNTQFTAGTTQYYIRVGHQASANATWSDAQGGSTQLYDSANVTKLVEVTGGVSGVDNTFNAKGGDGGTFTTGLPYQSSVIEYGNGEAGEDALELGSAFVTDIAHFGQGGLGTYGTNGKGVLSWIGALQDAVGVDAGGYGSGGSGCANDMNGVINIYGGQGSGGYAQFDFYYQ